MCSEGVERTRSGGGDLRGTAAHLPDRPGVYLFKDDRGRVLYVGKAKSLRRRVTQYFQVRPDREPRTEAMLRRAADLEAIETETEVEALLAEARLIKDLQPKYNVELKDGKSYPLLAISKGEDFPTVYVTRERDADRAIHYGPFTDASGLRQAAALLQRVFKFRTCDLSIQEGDPKNRHVRPCILHSIGQCTAPCADRIGKRAYREDIRGLRMFLSGRKRDLLDGLKRRMAAAADRLDYETAAALRDQVRALESLDQRARFGEFLPGAQGPLTPVDPRAAVEDLQRLLGLPAPPRTIEGVDAATLQGGESVGALVTFVDGIPFKDGYRRFKIRASADADEGRIHPPAAVGMDVGTGSDGGTGRLKPPPINKGADDYAMIREVVLRRFSRLTAEGEVYPQILLIDGGVGQLRAAAEALEEALPSAAGMPVLLSLAKREETLYRWGRAGAVKAQRHDLGLRLLMAVRDEAHRFAQHYHHVLRRRSMIAGKQRTRRPPRPDF